MSVLPTDAGLGIARVVDSVIQVEETVVPRCHVEAPVTREREENWARCTVVFPSTQVETCAGVTLLKGHTSLCGLTAGHFLT